MRIGVLGTGDVGRALASAWTHRGHEVCLGSRTRDNEVATAWAASGEGRRHGTFADAAAGADVVVNATAGAASLAALAAAGAADWDAVVLMDVANALDFSRGFPPRLAVPEDDSLAEQIQRTFPGTRVVKALCTVNVSVMVDPGSLSEPTDLFVAGDDDAAKGVVRRLLADLGWADDRIRDLGGVAASRSLERYLLLWLTLMQSLGTPSFNVRLVQ